VNLVAARQWTWNFGFRVGSWMQRIDVTRLDPPLRTEPFVSAYRYSDRLNSKEKPVMLERPIAMPPVPGFRQQKMWVTRASVILLTALAAGCAAPASTPPQMVQANNPTVTYNYRGDEELIKANQSAEVYCSKYQATARSQSIRDTPDGGKSAVFECAQNTASAVPGQTIIPGQSYRYQTDQELLDRTRNADAYCMSVGSRNAVSVIGTNPDGSKNVSYSCRSSQ
jgi:hypothetical protein